MPSISKYHAAQPRQTLYCSLDKGVAITRGGGLVLIQNLQRWWWSKTRMGLLVVHINGYVTPTISGSLLWGRDGPEGPLGGGGGWLS